MDRVSHPDDEALVGVDVLELIPVDGVKAQRAAGRDQQQQQRDREQTEPKGGLSTHNDYLGAVMRDA